MQGRTTIRFEYKTAGRASSAFRQFKTAVGGTRRSRIVTIHQLEKRGRQWWGVAFARFDTTKR